MLCKSRSGQLFSRGLGAPTVDRDLDPVPERTLRQGELQNEFRRP